MPWFASFHDLVSRTFIICKDLRSLDLPWSSRSVWQDLPGQGASRGGLRKSSRSPKSELYAHTSLAVLLQPRITMVG